MIDGPKWELMLDTLMDLVGRICHIDPVWIVAFVVLQENEVAEKCNTVMMVC